jgi:hypothetical protein
MQNTVIHAPFVCLDKIQTTNNTDVKEADKTVISFHNEGFILIYIYPNKGDTS